MLLFALAILGYSTPAQAGDVHLGWSDVGDPLVTGFVLGGEISAGYRQPVLDWLGVEARLTYVPDLAEARVDDLARTLVVISSDAGHSTGFHQPLLYDTFRGEVLADFGPLRDPTQVQAVPHLRLGVAVERRREYYLQCGSQCGSDAADGFTLERGAPSLAVPVVGELAFELWSVHNLGVRLAAGLLAERAARPQYDPQEPTTGRYLRTRSRLGLDVLYSFGAR